jgi:Cu2+-exporting ATPase
MDHSDYQAAREPASAPSELPPPKPAQATQGSAAPTERDPAHSSSAHRAPAHMAMNGGSHSRQHAGMSDDMSNPAMAASMEANIRTRFWLALALSAVVVLLSPMGEMLGIHVPLSAAARSWTLLALTTPIVFWCGWIFIDGAFRALRSLRLDMSVLIVVGVFAAYIASGYLTVIGSKELFYEAAAMLVTFVLFGHWMEMKSRRGSSDALHALFNLVPPKARVLRSGKELEIPTAEVVRDDVIVLRPGDRVPVDGEIVEGTTSIDESLVTGESLPVEKKPGSKVIGGSVNGAGSVKFKATSVGEETTLARIAKLVETAQNSKAPGQRLADKAAAYLVILAVAAGVATFISWRWGAGVSFVTALTFAISAVVIACPDALGLATPTAVAVATGLGARHNILIKDAETLEGASRITAVAFDKTGTLTEGKPRVVDTFSVPGGNENEALSLLAAAERGSNHPLAAAILEEAKSRKLDAQPKVDDFVNVSGHGLKATIGGRKVLVGNASFLTNEAVKLAPVKEGMDRMMKAGQTVILVAIDCKAALVVGVTDPIKPSAKRAVAELRKLGIETAMISGDNKSVAESVGKAVGIDRVFAEVLPEDKAEHVKTLQGEGKFVAMVGDGVNDAPALAQADIGIAIGAGTDVAIEAAKIVLMKSDPLDVLNAIILSKATVRKMKQNLVWASVYNLLAIPIAAGVFYPLWHWSLRPEISALLMSASSIIVAVNAVTLRRSAGEMLLTSDKPEQSAPSSGPVPIAATR